MRKSVLFFLACVGLVILSVLTAYVVLFEPSIRNLDGVNIKAYHPHDELESTQNGKALLDIIQVLESSVQDAERQLAEFDKSFSNDLAPNEAVQRLLILRIIATENGNNELTKQYTAQLERLSSNDHLLWLKIQLMIEESDYIGRRGKTHEATQIINKAINLANEHAFHFLLPRAHNVAGFLSNADNQLMEAQRHFMSGINVSNKIGDTSYLVRFYNNIGLLYLHIEKWNKALEFLDKALNAPIPSSLDENYLLQVLYLNKTYIYTQMNDVDNARDSYRTSLQYYDAAKASPRLKLIKLKGDARYNLFVGKYSDAIEAAEQCIHTHKAFDYPLQQGQCQLLKAKSLLKQEDFSSALAAIEDSIVTFSSISHKRWLIRSYKQKAIILDALGNKPDALKMYKRYYEQEKNQLLSQVYDLEHAFVTQHIRQEKELLNIENELAAAQLAKEKLRFQIACTWILIAAITIIYAFRKTSHVQNKNAELQNLSFVDELTTLHNRRYYTQQLETCQEIDGEIGYRIALFDLDNFKSVNDTYGHDVGDEVLVETASRLKELVSNTEMLIRWGGEEFLVLMRDDEHIGTRVDAMLDAIGLTAFSTQAGPLNITASIGVSPVALPASLAQDDGFFRKADQNLYEAKRSGKNRAIFPN
ncbi:conserved exported hypothetical protein [Vibrio nigripulchritudo SO65]|uniref:tetratricopeptide repeat-containing diguanylate cyclase n=1 Tax=Vibrio nigripulchritudo TaxID=28173 RepID=UPI0003B20FCD|nr:GGDEF domain-containing protein [Vibrio nigripulchritudo]CCN34672.1 conserved exported hypothetical protein [Vibrio nigripulchritudo AM115]CCN41079.1 conserved exported hypothetical protein [Vibrio nigripulchritudo FTn2]CCN66618.1 conserved exported hypothetical protein [Vibrio nigripulchritudo POn4]CCN75977.1 conserved exported hypothetical protein [Vibrio nigripulchritudo SO65]